MNPEPEEGLPLEAPGNEDVEDVLCPCEYGLQGHAGRLIGNCGREPVGSRGLLIGEGMSNGRDIRVFQIWYSREMPRTLPANLSDCKQRLLF